MWKMLIPTNKMAPRIIGFAEIINPYITYSILEVKCHHLKETIFFLDIANRFMQRARYPRKSIIL